MKRKPWKLIPNILQLNARKKRLNYIKRKNRNRNAEKVVVYLGFVLMLTLSMPPFTYRAFNKESTTANIDTRAYEYIWVYEKRNGVDYKRLYNVTTGKWVSDWIRAE